MFAVIETGGKQYLVAENRKIRVEKLPAGEGGKVLFPRVLLIFDDKTTEIGTPTVAHSTVEGEVLKQGRADKVIVFKYHAKTRYRKKKGHRQHFTDVLIKKILMK
ncbi:MAG: 50S ribosomal protein L21 [Candidatus Sungbacteria bacterium]|uniref:Large ribosomal subunit protein bL21 n=1 Tax=Candidatus Sungiibacteriota bacterium TaxID=2750080 RepID=A0A931SD62_9BACT|nr:50S ribosomal protein L21 [Candidatus Sungbacteria bacterium]